MFPTKIRAWLAQFKKYYFTYRKGFYHFPYNGNSPDTLVASFKGLPFVKHSAERQSVTTATPLMDGGFNYQKLEDGCWIVYSRMRYKANVAFDLLYDDAGDSDYYMLSLNNVSNSVRVYTSSYEGHVCMPKYSWTFFKPKEQNCSVNFKGDNSRFITLFFNEAWLQANLMSSSLFEEGGLHRFIRSNERHILWPISGEGAVVNNFEHFEEVMNIDAQAGRVDVLRLKFSVLNLIFDFFRLCKEQKVVDGHLSMDYTDQFNLDRVENYLNNHLCGKFPGIDFLSEKFGISKTKLKDEFKRRFGKPVYQHFQGQQMLLARDLLVEKHVLVKEISYKLGYESQSKFTAAFKKYHTKLPSEV